MTTPSFRDATATGAENYQRWFVPAIATPVSDALLEAAGLRAGERVLDVACGTGVIARLAAELVGPTGSVTGVDVAADMIDVAKSVPIPAGSPIEWQAGDAASLTFADGSFDAALCQMGLMFMADRLAVLREMVRVTTPGGRVVVSTPGTIQRPFVLMERAITEHINPELGGFVRAVFSMDDPDALATLLRDAGLRDVSVAEPVVKLRLPAPREFLWQYINLTPMGPLVADAAESAKAAMEHQVVESWRPFVVDGTTPVDQPMVVGSGRAA